MVYGDPVMDWELDVAEEKSQRRNEWSREGWVEWRCPISLIAEGWGKGERGNVWFISWALVQTSYSSKFVIGLEVTFRTEMEPDRDVGCGWRRRGDCHLDSIHEASIIDLTLCAISSGQTSQYDLGVAKDFQHQRWKVEQAKVCPQGLKCIMSFSG